MIKLAIFCSNKCPGSSILKSYEYAKYIRLRTDITVIGGFHTKIEKDVLEILLEGKCPIVFTPARSIENMRIPVKWRPHLDSGRIQIISAFKPYERRITKENSIKRNNYIAHMADEILIIYASPGGTLETHVNEWVEAGLNVNWL